MRLTPLYRILAVSLLVLFVLALGGGISTPVAAIQSEDEEDDAEDIILFVQDTLTAANIYWDGEFRRLGVAYERPDIVLARGGVPTPSDCDEEEPVVEHSYCALDTTVTIDIDSDGDDALVDPTYTDAPLASVWLVAHEVAHHVQHLLDLDGLADSPENTRYELQADCLAGAFVRTYARAADWVEHGDLDGAVAKVRESADPEDIPGHDRTHGTAPEREQAFRRGYDAGSPSACGISAPQAPL